MPQKAKKSNKKLFIGIGIGVAVVAVIAIIVGVVIANSKPKKLNLTPGQAVSVASLNLAVAMDKLDGSGSVTPSTCETFREIAKQYNSKTDWFSDSYCKYIIYADYNKTENTTTVTLSDGTHAANYVFDADLNQLLDYKFTESSVKGRSISID